jgi:hypothetical protein
MEMVPEVTQGRGHRRKRLVKKPEAYNLVENLLLKEHSSEK